LQMSKKHLNYTSFKFAEQAERWKQTKDISYLMSLGTKSLPPLPTQINFDMCKFKQILCIP
jgi:hypothetical protein